MMKIDLALFSLETADEWMDECIEWMYRVQCWNVIKVYIFRFRFFDVDKKPMIKCLFASQSSQNHHKVE